MALLTPNRIQLEPIAGASAEPYQPSPEELAQAKTSCFFSQLQANPTAFTTEAKAQLKSAIDQCLTIVGQAIDSLNTRRVQITDQIIQLNKEIAGIKVEDSAINNAFDLARPAAEACQQVSETLLGVKAAANQSLVQKRELTYRLGLAEDQKGTVLLSIKTAEDTRKSLEQMRAALS